MSKAPLRPPAKPGSKRRAAALSGSGSGSGSAATRAAEAASTRRDAEYVVGAKVVLYHKQKREWQPGIIVSRRKHEVGLSWKYAEGWNPDWTDVAAETVQVDYEQQPGRHLYWDAECTDSLPKQLWGARLRLWVDGVTEPLTVDEAQRWRGRETRDAATSGDARGLVRADNSPFEDDEAAAASHRATDALLQVILPPPPTCPAAPALTSCARARRTSCAPTAPRTSSTASWRPSPSRTTLGASPAPTTS